MRKKPLPKVPPKMAPVKSVFGDMRERVPLSFWVGYDAKGDLFLLASDDAVMDAANKERADFERIMDTLKTLGYSDAEINAHRAGFVAKQAATIAEYKRERDAALPHALRLDYVLVLPLFGNWQKLVNQAHQIPLREGTSPEVAHDVRERAYREMLLKNNGVERPDGLVFSPSDIDHLHPVVRDTLGHALAARLHHADPRKRMLAPPPSAKAVPFEKEKGK